MKSVRNALAVAVAALLLPHAAHAQKLEVGKWTGTVTPPNQGPMEVTYDVTMSGDTLSVILNAAPHGSFKFNNITIADGKMTFSWSPGDANVACTLELKPDATWAGPCTEEGGSNPGQMVMVPPKKQS